MFAGWKTCFVGLVKLCVSCFLLFSNINLYKHPTCHVCVLVFEQKPSIILRNQSTYSILQDFERNTMLIAIVCGFLLEISDAGILQI